MMVLSVHETLEFDHHGYETGFIKGQAPDKLAGCEDNFAHLV